MLSQWFYILKLEERPKGEEAEKRGNLSPLEIPNDGRMLDLIHIFGKADALHKLTFTPFRECSQYFHIHLLHTKLFTFTQITFFLRRLHSSTQISYHQHFQKKIPFEEGTLDKRTSYKSLRWIPRSAKYQLRGIRQLCQEHRTNWLSSPKRHRICNWNQIDDDTISRRQYVRSGNEFAVVLARYVDLSI